MNAADTRMWVVPREAPIERRDLTPSEILDLESRGYERFTIGRGKFPAIVGFAENPFDVGELRRIFNQQDASRNVDNS